MGSGHNTTNDVPRRISSLGVETGEAELGADAGVADPAEQCAVTRTVEFRTRGRSNPLEGDPVSVEAADPPLLLNARGNIIGYLVGPGVVRVRACIAGGWRFEGKVDSVTEAGGTAAVSGHK